MKILIVDDDLTRGSSLRDYLMSEPPLGASSIVLCDNAVTAKQLMRESYFDGLVLDVVLPKRSGESPSPRYGLELLKQLSRSTTLRKPEKIIGITAHSEDLANFRNEFLELCAVVIEARPTTTWKRQIAKSFGYTDSSKLARSLSEHRTVVVTVHGIRTYGQWQSRLRDLVTKRTDLIEFHNYKYGYFTIASFLIPPFRWVQVSRLLSRFRLIQNDLEGRKVVVFSHSFGTYLVAMAVKRLVFENNVDLTLVLCGSVLRSNFDWSFINGKNVKIINDCGDSDYVLWGSQAAALGLGMAGKVGFYGFNNNKIINRFFRGSHSLYFEGNGFMEKHWIPLLTDSRIHQDIDDRPDARLLETYLEGLVNLLAWGKPFVYFLVLALAAYSVYHTLKF